jgi:hypothetical protein
MASSDREAARERYLGIDELNCLGETLRPADVDEQVVFLVSDLAEIERAFVNMVKLDIAALEATAGG